MSRLTRSALARANIIVDEPAIPEPAVHESEPAVPEPAVPEPAVPEPAVPAVPVVPEPAPAAPEPAPAAPEPAPAAPEPAPSPPVNLIVSEPAPAAAPKPATNIAAAENMYEWLVRIHVSGADDDIEIHYGKGQLYIFENYFDTDNNKNTSKTKVTPALLKSWLKLWFKSLRMDTHPKWTSVNVYFNLMPAIATPRADLSKNRAYDLIDHIRNAVDFHIALAAVNM